MTNEVRIALGKVCSLPNNHQVEYLIIGGTAVGVYGYNRISGGPSSREKIVDIDFWYNPTIENFHNLINVLDELDIQTESLKEIVFDPTKTFLRIPHQGFQTEFLPQVKGLNRPVDQSDILELKANQRATTKLQVDFSCR